MMRLMRWVTCFSISTAWLRASNGESQLYFLVSGLWSTQQSNKWMNGWIYGWNCYQIFGEEGDFFETAHPQVVQHGQGVLALLRSTAEEEFSQAGSLHCVVVGPRCLSSQVNHFDLIKSYSHLSPSGGGRFHWRFHFYCDVLSCRLLRGETNKERDRSKEILKNWKEKRTSTSKTLRCVVDSREIRLS